MRIYLWSALCFKNHGFENEGFENEGFNCGFRIVDCGFTLPFNPPRGWRASFGLAGSYFAE